jgi:putative SOS response-associated peptidase YedK
MCGRFLLMTSGKDIAEFFDLAAPPELFPRYNVAPTQPVLGVRAGAAGREAALLRWGLVPPWAKDAKQAPINARAETAADKPMFRTALRKRRCLIPASGFYEWVALAGEKRKQPYCFRPRDEEVFAFAGLWERWQGPAGPVDQQGDRPQRGPHAGAHPLGAGAHLREEVLPPLAAVLHRGPQRTRDGGSGGRGC